MKKILNEKGEVLFTGTEAEMEMAYKYLTLPGWVLAEKYGLRHRDLINLNTKYWNEKSRAATSFQLVSDVELIEQLETAK